MFSAVLLLPEQSAGQIVFVPAGLDQDDRGVGFETRVQVVIEPIPDTLAIRFAFRFGTAADGIVDDDEVCSKAGDASADADRTDASAEAGLPFGNGIEPSS